MWRRKIKRDALIDGHPVFIEKLAERGMTRLRDIPDDPKCQRLQAFTGNPHYPDATPSGRRGIGGNDIRTSHSGKLHREKARHMRISRRIAAHQSNELPHFQPGHFFLVAGILLDFAAARSIMRVICHC